MTRQTVTSGAPAGSKEAEVSAEHAEYYVPNPSPWPIVATVSAFGLLLGTALAVNDLDSGFLVIAIALAVFAYLLYAWFGDVVRESLRGEYSEKVDRSFRYGMMWFIASEVFFFMAFFGSLYYLRAIALPWLGGEGYLAHSQILHDGFSAAWPSAGPEKLGGPFHAMSPWGVPALNTLILLSSGATITWAHWGLKMERRKHLVWGLMATIALGVTFVFMQAFEYREAYAHLNLTLGTGVYGSTFYLLTGFHGFHVTVGAIMLMAILGRSLRGHFRPANHFGFEAVAWYWHFVDVVWLGLFIFVYML
jgi:cytochrome c oxidase subunit 3